MAFSTLILFEHSLKNKPQFFVCCCCWNNGWNLTNFEICQRKKAHKFDGKKKLQKYTTEYFLCLVLYFLFCYMITNTLTHTHMFIYIIIKTYLTSSHGKKHCWYIFIFKSFHPIIFHIFLCFWLYLCVYCFIVCVCVL